MAEPDQILDSIEGWHWTCGDAWNTWTEAAKPADVRSHLGVRLYFGNEVVVAGHLQRDEPCDLYTFVPNGDFAMQPATLRRIAEFLERR